MDRIEAAEELTEGQVITVDGKRLRRSHDRSKGKKALQMASDGTHALHEYVQLDSMPERAALLAAMIRSPRGQLPAINCG